MESLSVVESFFHLAKRYIIYMRHFHTSDQRKVSANIWHIVLAQEYQCVYLVKAYISLFDDTQWVYPVNLRHCTHLIGDQKSVKSADFFDTVILSLSSII